jgi:hypothetical protein
MEAWLGRCQMSSQPHVKTIPRCRHVPGSTHQPIQQLDRAWASSILPRPILVLGTGDYRGSQVRGCVIEALGDERMGGGCALLPESVLSIDLLGGRMCRASRERPGWCCIELCRLQHAGRQHHAPALMQ